MDCKFAIAFLCSVLINVLNGYTIAAKIYHRNAMLSRGIWFSHLKINCNLHFCSRYQWDAFRVEPINLHDVLTNQVACYFDVSLTNQVARYFDVSLTNQVACYLDVTNQVACYSEEYQEAIRVQHDLMSAAITEVEDYCDNNSWLNEINKFCNDWTAESVTRLEGAAAFTIEVRSFFDLMSFYCSASFV